MWRRGSPPPGAPPTATKLTNLKILQNPKMAISEFGGDDFKPYWCVIRQRLLPNDDGVIVHDAVPHPDEMTFDEEDRPQ